MSAGMFSVIVASPSPQTVWRHTTWVGSPPETTGVVQEVLRSRTDITELDARGVLQGVSASPIDLAGDGSGRVQLWPHRHGTDAMFLALLQRTATEQGDANSEERD